MKAPSSYSIMATAAILAAAIIGRTMRRVIERHTPAQRHAASLAVQPNPRAHAAPESLHTTLQRIFKEEGVPEALIWVAEVESAWNPAALSPAGALGLYQIMPDTAIRFRIATEHHDKPLDPEVNARIAARYLRHLHERFGDWTLVLAAYNAGENRVHRLLLQTGGNAYADIHTRLPSETQAYVDMVKAIIESSEKSSFHLFH